MKAVPEVTGKPWTRWVGLAVLFVYAGLAGLDVVPSGKEGLITSLLLAAFTWLAPSPSVRTAPVWVLMLALPLLAGCSYKGVTVGWGSIQRETSTYSVQAAVMPDSNADVIHTQASYTRKDGVVPNVEATITRPSPNVAQVDVWVRGLAPAPVAVPAPAKGAERTYATTSPKRLTKLVSPPPVCPGGVCAVPVVVTGPVVDSELWK